MPDSRSRAPAPRASPFGKPGAWVELALTLPVFLAYQLGVVFLNVRNATDLVTSGLLEAAHGDRLLYLSLTTGIGLAMMVTFAVLGRGEGLRFGKIVQIAAEGAVYALAMGVTASWVVGRLFAGVAHGHGLDAYTGVVMSLGAGFYEELAFRAVLFGLGSKALLWLMGKRKGRSIGVSGAVAVVTWGVICAAVFSGMHYVGALGDHFDARSFVARATLGLALTLVYGVRGFAAAVWTHALYDIWVLVL